jgi:inactivated superfamily I helicase
MTNLTPIARSLEHKTNAELAELTKLVQLRGNTPPHLSDLLEVVRARLLKESSKDYIPTKKARFCNQAGDMGGGCEDSWHIGGNYGGHVCRNPNHHGPAEAGGKGNG